MFLLPVWAHIFCYLSGGGEPFRHVFFCGEEDLRRCLHWLEAAFSYFLLVELFSTLLLLGESRFAMSSSSGGGPLTMSSRLEAAFSYLLGRILLSRHFQIEGEL